MGEEVVSKLPQAYQPVAEKLAEEYGIQANHLDEPGKVDAVVDAYALLDALFAGNQEHIRLWLRRIRIF